MPIISAFQGWRYDAEKVPDPAAVLAPPYDVISPREQTELYARSPLNVVRLILGKKKRGDNASRNSYTRAAGTLKQWIARGALTQEDRPAVYVYAQDYRERGRRRRRLGFIAAMKIDEKAVLKHERTLSGPKKDRLALLKAVRTNLSPVFGLIDDRKGGIHGLLKQSLRLAPAIDVSLGGVRHRLFVEKRPALLNSLKKKMAARPVYIADGHHRFEVACQFRDWMRGRIGRSAPKASADQSAAGAADWDYVMTYFSDYRHNPFSIFPTHRLVRVPKRVREPLAALKRRGGLEKAKDLASVLGRLREVRDETRHPGRYQFGVYVRNGGFYLFTLAGKNVERRSAGPVGRLDVAVLHQRLLEPCFRIRAVERSRRIDFTRDAATAVAEVKKGRFDLALFLRPTSLEEVIRVSKKGLRMPQKSTYFYPKLLSGLVFHRFND